MFTGDWFLPNEEANAVTNLADQGIDVVTGHVNSPKVLIDSRSSRNLFLRLSRERFLTCAAALSHRCRMELGAHVREIRDRFPAGATPPRNVMGSLKDGSVKMSPYGPAVSDDAKKACEEVKSKMMAGTFQMFKGPLKDNKGNVVLPEGKAFDDQDPAYGG